MVSSLAVFGFGPRRASFDLDGCEFDIMSRVRSALFLALPCNLVFETIEFVFESNTLPY